MSGLAALLALSGGRDALDHAGAEFLGVGEIFFFQCVSGKRREHGPAARKDAEQAAERGARSTGAIERLMSSPRRPSARHFPLTKIRAAPGWSVGDESRRCRHAHRDGTKPMPSNRSLISKV